MSRSASLRVRPVSIALAAVLTLAGLTACEPTVLITAPGEATAPVETAGERAVGYAQSELGTPYLWGGRTPGVGFDCSGLTSWAWGQAGTFLPRTSGDQYTFTSRIARADLRAGDLVFYAADGVTISHVAMYVGDGRIIHARKTGTYVEYQGIDWWASNRVGYGRVGA